MDPAGRLLRLLSTVQDRPGQTANQLAHTLHVTARTVRRDIERLRSLGYQVDAEAGRSGYSLGVGNRLPPLLLDDDEAFAIAHGLRLAASAPVAGVDQAALGALGKLDQLLPERIRQRVRAVDVATIHTDGPTNHDTSIDTLILLAVACREHQTVRLNYEDFNGHRSDRRVEPLRLVFASRRWYLVGWDLDRRDWRTYRADRIERPTLTGHTFHHDNPPDAARRVLEGIAYLGRPVTARVLVDVDADDARRRYGQLAGIEPAPHGRSVLLLGGDDLNQIARHIASMSCTWTVLDPPELRDEVIRHSQHLARLAAGTSLPSPHS